MIDTRQTGETDPRVRFAAERTFLAWVRTSLALMGFGFIVARSDWLLQGANGSSSPLAHPSTSLLFGVALVVLGVIINLAAATEHFIVIMRFNRGEPYRPHPWPIAVSLAAVLAALGIGMITYLLSAAG